MRDCDMLQMWFGLGKLGTFTEAVIYEPRGRRGRGRPRKRWQCVDAGTGQTT